MDVGVGAWSANGIGVLAQSDNIAIKAQGGQLAARFEGDVEVTGDLRLVNGNDLAENFDWEAIESEPGTVGSVIGKALAPLSDGLGLIPILIALQ